jgi:hypothetical protein
MRGLGTACFFSFLLGSTALAQEGGMDRARAHMDRGQELYLQGSFVEAAAEFEAAYAAHPFSAFLYNAGLSLERAGQSERAIEFFRRYAEAERNDANEVRERVRALEANAAAPAQEGSTDLRSMISVRTNPEGATVTVRRGDRVIAQGPGPFSHTLPRGSYSLSVEHADFRTVTQEVRVQPGRVFVVVVEMSQGQFLGYLRVASNVPGARVFIDNREQGHRGETPFETPIPVGSHHIWVERPGYAPAETHAEIGLGDDVTANVDLERLENGRLRVTGNVAGARVLVDGTEVGHVPFEGDVGGGPHRVRVESNGMKAFEETVMIERGQLTPMRVRLRPDVDRSGAIVTTVFASLVLAGAITTAVIGNEMRTTLADEQAAGRLASDDPRLQEGFILYIVADAAFGMTVLLGGLALLFFLQDNLPPSEGSVQEPRDWSFAPLIDPERGVAGLSLSGRL